MARPTDGGCAIDLATADGTAAVAESVSVVHHKIQLAIDEFAQTGNPEKLWIELTVLADPDEEVERRPCWLKSDAVICLTYLTPAQVEKIEHEIS